tara:strand:- start:53 stop:244 length:192 start_codon:yes stop_codon:yes gene_type:complete
MKNIKNLKHAKARIVQEINLGETDNISLYKKLAKERIGLTPRELSELVNKHTEEYLLSEGWVR